MRFVYEDDAHRACKSLHGSALGGKQLVVEPAILPPPPPEIAKSNSNHIFPRSFVSVISMGEATGSTDWNYVPSDTLYLKHLLPGSSQGETSLRE